MAVSAEEHFLRQHISKHMDEPIHVFGLVTSFHKLFNSGWKFSYNKNQRYHQEFAFRNEAAGLVLFFILRSFGLTSVCLYRDTDIVRVNAIPTFASFGSNNDPENEWISMTDHKVFEYFGFSREETTPSGIVISRENIAEVLEMIRKVQAPAQKEIRQRTEVAAKLLTVAA